MAKTDEIHSKMTKLDHLGVPKHKNSVRSVIFGPMALIFQNFTGKLKFRTICCQIALLCAVEGLGGAESVEGPRDPSKNDVIGPERGPATKNNARKTNFQ